MTGWDLLARAGVKRGVTTALIERGAKVVIRLNMAIDMDECMDGKK